MDKAADVKIKQRVRKDRRKMHYDNDWLRGDKWQGFRKGKVRVRQDGEEAVSGLSSGCPWSSILQSSGGCP